VFAAAYAVSPWGIQGLRVVYLVFDILTLLVLIRVLSRLGLPMGYLTIYWWNPLLVKEVYNSLHMDVVVLPLVLGGLYLASMRCYASGVFKLVLGIGVKLWPIAALPVVLREVVGSRRKLLPALGVAVVGIAALLAPLWLWGLRSGSGMGAYARSWENNDSAFKLILWVSQSLLPLFGVHPGWGQLLARLMVVLFLGIWMAYVLRRRSSSPRELFDRGVLIVGALFLLSPTQFPWYYVWLIPMLAVSPRTPFLVLTALLPLYYLGYYYPSPKEGRFLKEYVLVWVQFVPVWALLAWNWYAVRRGGARAV